MCFWSCSASACDCLNHIILLIAQWPVDRLSAEMNSLLVELRCINHLGNGSYLCKFISVLSHVDSHWSFRRFWLQWTKQYKVRLRRLEDNSFQGGELKCTTPDSCFRGLQAVLVTEFQLTQWGFDYGAGEWDRWVMKAECSRHKEEHLFGGRSPSLRGGAQPTHGPAGDASHWHVGQY